MRLGVIADDFTGASDIAGFLVEGGMRTIMYNGVPKQKPKEYVDALVVSLKIRSCPVEQAIDEAIQALKFLIEIGCDKFYYKFCSTFDSTKEGNIGPVVDAIMSHLKTSLTIICPSLPVNGRTVCHGYLFVNHELLSDSSMRYHPITPMLDSKLSRLMEGQFKGKTDHIYYSTISKGATEVRDALEKISKTNVKYVVVDTLTNDDLDAIAEATESMLFVAGGSGLSIGITNVLNKKRDIQKNVGFTVKKQKGIIITGSCSKRTNEQVDYYKDKAPSRYIEESRSLEEPNKYALELADWVISNIEYDYYPLLYATKPAEELKKSKELYGDSNVAEAIEKVIALVVKAIAKQDVKTFIVGGGETSGVVATTLNVNAYLIGAQIDPGVSWLQELDGDMQFSYKSGNFGEIDFFTKAQDMQA
jgi:uncharacterized protein YgbK (DUF1537 family)